MDAIAYPRLRGRAWRLPTPVLAAFMQAWIAWRRYPARREDGERQWKVGVKYACRSCALLFLPSSKLRALALCYLWIRFVDDIEDRDAPVPYPHTYESYLARKATVLDTGIPDGFEDELLVRMHEEGARHGINLHDDLRLVWQISREESIDREWRIVSLAELRHQAEMMDTAILTIFCKGFGAHIKEAVRELDFIRGIYTRTESLADLVGDLASGRINIPLETVEERGFDPAVLLLRPSWEVLVAMPGFLTWYKGELAALAAEWQRLEVRFEAWLHEVMPTATRAYVARKLLWRIFATYMRRASDRLALS
jgi:hypothetical protein